MRALSIEECDYVSGGEDGGCGEGDCGDDGGSGVGSGDPNCGTSVTGETTTCWGFDAAGNLTVTTTGTAPPPGFMSIGDSVALGSLAGTAIAFGAVLTGSVGTMAVGDALALGALLGGVAGLVALGLTAAAIAAYIAIENIAIESRSMQGTGP
jgi:hypothetical protein